MAGYEAFSSSGAPGSPAGGQTAAADSAHNVRKVCSTVVRTPAASDHVGFTTVAPPPEPREATCECVENKKGGLTGRLCGGGRERLSCLSGFCVRQSGIFDLARDTAHRHTVDSCRASRAPVPLLRGASSPPPDRPSLPTLTLDVAPHDLSIQNH